MIDGKRIVLGVSGSIAAYKAPELVRRLSERSATVRVVLTEGGQRFVTPLTLQAVSGNPVRTSLWDEAAEAAMGHIELARWAERILIAPASANLIARLAQGLSDDLLCTLCLASDAPLILAPAMNRLMWQHPATQSNLALLRERGAVVLGPDRGEQACGEHGAGRLLAVDELLAQLEILDLAPLLQGVRVLVSAGPTREAIDPVRYLSNASSGRMGYAVARAAARAGAIVSLVSGPVGLMPPHDVETIATTSASEMYTAILERAEHADIFIGCAAVSDYRPADVMEQKIKKSAAQMSLSLVRNPDILATVSALEAPRRPFCVGFAAETERLAEYAERKLAEKGLDMIAANRVDGGRGFDVGDNALTVFWPGGQQSLPQQSKGRLAAGLMRLVAQRYHRVRPGASH